MRVSAGVKYVPPAPGDFPEIKPGQSWTYEKGLMFPGYVPDGSYSATGYTVLKPGEFGLKFSYIRKESNDPLAKGAWTGELTSNELVIAVKPPTN
jgi:hypothetical protein